MEYLLFAAYLALFCWLVTKVRFFLDSGLTKSQLIILFLLKIMAGIFYGWVGIYYGNLAQMVDTWSYHYLGLREYHLLQTNPREYLTNLFYDPYEGGVMKFFSSTQSYWNDLKANAIIKLISIFDIFSFGNYYINIIYYSFLSLFGPVALYRVMKDIFPGRELAVAIATFLIPSFIYWTSGLHKDGLVFTGLGVIAWHMYFGLKTHSFPMKRWLVMICSFGIILVFKNNIAAILLPALLAWWLAHWYGKRGLLVFSIVYIVFGILFFSAKYISSDLDLPLAVVHKQEAFMQLRGNSRVEVRKLEPNIVGFLRNTPQALEITMLRPYPSDVMHLLSLAACVETILLLLLVVLFVFFRDPGPYPRLRPFVWFCIFFSFSLLLSVGYTVNFLGAVVRYRSLVIPFLFVPVIAQTNWMRIRNLVAGFIIK